jgi:FlaA1/EpsC-like NDP-sugar epimerase
MGEQIRILDLARELIQLSGLEPGKDIDIAFTGTRPGEKLSEELFIDGEEPRCTRHEKILMAHGNNCWSNEALCQHLEELEELTKSGRARQIRSKLQEIVPDYQPAEAKMLE